VPTVSDLLDANNTTAGVQGLKAPGAVVVHHLGDEATSMSQREIVNSGSVARAFWFCVRGNHSTKPAVFTVDGSNMIAKNPNDITGGEITMAPASTPTGWTSGVSYKVWGIMLNPGSTYVRIN
jgi:hypothetical protein